MCDGVDGRGSTSKSVRLQVRVLPGAPNPVHAVLEHAWTAIRRHHPDVPQAVIVVASGSDDGSRRLNLVTSPFGR
jgi:hypothetical protein